MVLNISNNSNERFEYIYNNLLSGDQLIIDIHIKDIISELDKQKNNNIYKFSTIMTKYEYQLLYPIFYQITTYLTFTTDLYTNDYFDAVVDIEFATIDIPNKYLIDSYNNNIA